ncbi:MAG: hypothetical protein GX998_10800 [Firmicutes bacterium]|nr:hypothetical protein [Bacillota bacterium]
MPNGMEKEQITKDDGRYLIYYRFDDEKDGVGDDATVCRRHACPSSCCGGTSSTNQETSMQDAKGV